MEASLCDALSRACGECHLSGGCCFEARPPLIAERIDILLDSGVSRNEIDLGGYKRLKLRPDGFCVLFRDGKCSIHSIKPETCVAGPFTFDMKGSILEIYLKTEKICPMVKILKENKEIYDGLFEVAVEKIVHLVENLPKNELEEILKIEEPDTELVAEIRLKDWPLCR